MGKNSIHFSTKNNVHSDDAKLSNKFKLYSYVPFKKKENIKYIKHTYSGKCHY